MIVSCNKRVNGLYKDRDSYRQYNFKPNGKIEMLVGTAHYEASYSTSGNTIEVTNYAGVKSRLKIESDSSLVMSNGIKLFKSSPH